MILISLLKETGSTLEEIKKHRMECETRGYLNFLKERVALLQEEQMRLARRISMLTRLVAMAEEAATSDFDTLFFDDRASETVVFYPAAPEKMINREASVECYSACLLDSLKHGNTIDSPLGMVVPKENAKNGEFRVCHFFSKILEKGDRDIREISEGRYACLFHKGDIESHKIIFNDMINEIYNMKLHIFSDVYIYDQMGYILTDISTDYVAKYIVKIG